MNIKFLFLLCFILVVNSSFLTLFKHQIGYDRRYRNDNDKKIENKFSPNTGKSKLDNEVKNEEKSENNEKDKEDEVKKPSENSKKVSFDDAKSNENLVNDGKDFQDLMKEVLKRQGDLSNTHVFGAVENAGPFNLPVKFNLETPNNNADMIGNKQTEFERECEIKQGYMLHITKADQRYGALLVTVQPSFVVLNPETISVFADDQVTALVDTTNLAVIDPLTSSSLYPNTFCFRISSLGTNQPFLARGTPPHLIDLCAESEEYLMTNLGL